MYARTVCAREDLMTMPSGTDRGFGGMLESTLASVSRAKRYHRWLAETIAPHVVGTAVEVGAGYGTLARALEPVLGRVLVTEADPAIAAGLASGVASVREIVFLPSAPLPLRQPPAWQEAPDTLIMSNVLEHIEEDQEALVSIRRHIATVRRLVLVVPAHDWAFTRLDAALGHYRRYTVASMRDILTVAGWKPQVVRYFNPVGALGWASGRIFRRSRISEWQTQVVEGVLPILRIADRLFDGRWFGQSVLAVADRARS